MPDFGPIVAPACSLFNRLRENGRSARTNAEMARAMKLDIHQSLENLLNTRRRRPENTSHAKALDQSLLNYGLPDFTHYLFKVDSHREQFRRQVQEAITRFEPRLLDVRVMLSDYDESQPQLLNMTIYAHYSLPKHNLDVQFHSSFCSSTQEVKVREVLHG